MASFDQSRSFIATISAQLKDCEPAIVVSPYRLRYVPGHDSEGWLGFEYPHVASPPTFWFGCYDYGSAGVMYEIRAYQIHNFEGYGLDVSTNGYLGLYSNASSSLHWSLMPASHPVITQSGQYAGIELWSKKGPVCAGQWWNDTFLYLNVKDQLPLSFKLEVKTMGVPRP